CWMSLQLRAEHPMAPNRRRRSPRTAPARRRRPRSKRRRDSPPWMDGRGPSSLHLHDEAVAAAVAGEGRTDQLHRVLEAAAHVEIARPDRGHAAWIFAARAAETDRADVRTVGRRELGHHHVLLAAADEGATARI